MTKLAAAVDAGTSGAINVLFGLVAVPGIGWPGFNHSALEDTGVNVHKLLNETVFWGRCAADDKAGILMHLAAVRVLDTVMGPGHGLGLTVFVEGEEESGSPTLPALLDQHGPRFQADAAVVADSGSWKIGTPALTTSLRGR